MILVDNGCAVTVSPVGAATSPAGVAEHDCAAEVLVPSDAVTEKVYAVLVVKPVISFVTVAPLAPVTSTLVPAPSTPVGL